MLNIPGRQFVREFARSMCSRYLLEVEMLGQIALKVNEVRQLGHKRALIEERACQLKASLSSINGVALFIPKETVMARRMHLSMMETKLARIDAQLGHYVDSGENHPA
jgi:hypothetical protein